MSSARSNLPSHLLDCLAVVDLGSNSFRLEVAKVVDGHIERLDYLKETVRQGELEEGRCLSVSAMERGIRCLERFGERLRGFPSAQVRAVATQTLREAKNRAEFLALAQSALGFPIEVISGIEEARLIYEGVSRTLPDLNERRLVIDIGGRSTEFVLGQGHESIFLESHRVGSVSWTSKYFSDGLIDESRFERARLAAASFLEASAHDFVAAKWSRAYGCSGTVGAVAEILAAAGFAPELIDSAGLDWLRSQLLRAADVNKLRLEGLKEDRRPIIAGGVAVLQAIFDGFGLQCLYVAKGALRHGVMFELADRLGMCTGLRTSSKSERPTTDVRDRAVARLQSRLGLDSRHAIHVAQTALQLYEQLGQLPAADGSKDATPELALKQSQAKRQLGWAALLHEAGLSISHTDAHRHGAYIVANSDLAGFSQGEQARIAQLILGQRGKLKKLDDYLEDAVFAHQLICLRVAVVLCHARRYPDFQVAPLQSVSNGWLMDWPVTLAKTWPQTDFLLRAETVAWEKIGRVFELRDVAVTSDAQAVMKTD